MNELFHLSFSNSFKGLQEAIKISYNSKILQKQPTFSKK